MRRKASTGSSLLPADEIRRRAPRKGKWARVADRPAHLDLLKGLVTLEGSWGYYEYDWVARPGDFVYELPGSAHTLYSDDPNGMKALFWINGPIEFYKDDGTFDEIYDRYFEA